MQTVPLYDDRWLLRDGSRRRPRLLQWAEKNEFTKLADITFGYVDRWRNTWSFGKSPTSRGSGLGSGAKDTLTRLLTRPADVLPGWIFNQNGLREMAVDYFD